MVVPDGSWKSRKEYWRLPVSPRLPGRAYGTSGCAWVEIPVCTPSALNWSWAKCSTGALGSVVSSIMMRNAMRVLMADWSERANIGSVDTSVAETVVPSGIPSNLLATPW